MHFWKHPVYVSEEGGNLIIEAPGTMEPGTMNVPRSDCILLSRNRFLLDFVKDWVGDIATDHRDFDVDSLIS